jgi:hypothetical protein
LIGVTTDDHLIDDRFAGDANASSQGILGQAASIAQITFVDEHSSRDFLTNETRECFWELARPAEPATPGLEGQSPQVVEVDSRWLILKVSDRQL